MPADMLVKLYELEDDWSFLAKQRAKGVTVRKPIGPERRLLVEWIERTFNPVWASEMDAALANTPRTAFIAVKDEKFIGFCCYDATARGIVGPLGVDENFRSGGTGSACYMACLLDMKLAGYGYCQLGMIAEDMMGYYHHLSGAVAIPGSGESVWKTWVHTID